MNETQTLVATNIINSEVCRRNQMDALIPQREYDAQVLTNQQHIMYMLLEMQGVDTTDIRSQAANRIVQEDGRYGRFRLSFRMISE